MHVGIRLAVLGTNLEITMIRICTRTQAEKAHREAMDLVSTDCEGYFCMSIKLMNYVRSYMTKYIADNKHEIAVLREDVLTPSGLNTDFVMLDGTAKRASSVDSYNRIVRRSKHHESILLELQGVYDHMADEGYRPYINRG
jgi:putative N-acetylmannosamine-6-phosphate epimerase